MLPHHPKQKTTEQLELERERAVEAERCRADQLEEQRSVAQLENELLTEMVAAEQVCLFDPRFVSNNQLGFAKSQTRYWCWKVVCTQINC